MGSSTRRQHNLSTSYRFDPETRAILRRVAEAMRLKEAQALRQIIWAEAERRGLVESPRQARED